MIDFIFSELQDFIITVSIFGSMFFLFDYLLFKKFVFINIKRFTSANKKAKLILIIIICSLLLLLFGSKFYIKYNLMRLEKSSQLGFTSVEEMDEILDKGFKSKDEWLLSEARRLGFNDANEMINLTRVGFSNKEKYNSLLKDFNSEKDLKQALENGLRSRIDYDNFLETEKIKGNFDSIADLKEALSKGFKNKKDYEIVMAQKTGFNDDINQMKLAKSKGIGSYADYLRFLDDSTTWVKIYSSGYIHQNKGGVFIEKHWFTPDEVKIRESSVSQGTLATHYLSKNSIRAIDEDVREAYFFRSYSGDNLLDGKRNVEIIQINCKSGTIRQVGSYTAEIHKATKQKDIDQATGRVTITTIPSSKEIIDIDRKIEEWEDISTNLFNKDEYGKYKSAVCNGNTKELVNTQISSS